jgi:hypothetical protein
MPTEEKDVVISFFCNVSKNIQGQFSRPTKFIQMPSPPKDGPHANPYMNLLYQYGWPHPIRGILANFGGDIKALRIAVMGFSEGCQGVTSVLSSKDAGFIDTAIAIDGISGGFVNDKPNKERDNVKIASVAPWIEFCKIASMSSPDPNDRPDGKLPIGRRTSVITHSSIVPPRYAATKYTARTILNTLFGEGNWPAQPIPAGISDIVYQPELVLNGNKINNYQKTSYPYAPIDYVSHKMGMYVYGFKDLDPTGINDHIYQSELVLPQTISTILAPNWNNVDPKAAACYTPTSAPSYVGVIPGCDPNAGTIIPPSATDPSIPESDLPDGSLNYDKWIPKSEKEFENTKKDIKRVETMSTYMKIFFLALSGALGYAGIKATQAIVEDAK